jgi:DNA-binding NarL/FixJ family response regulator
MDGREHPPTAPARVLIGLRDRLIAEALGRLLTDAGFRVTGCLCDPSALLEQAVRSLPDAVLVGTDMLGADAELLLLEDLRTRAPSVRAVVMARDISEHGARAMVQFGVRGVIPFRADGDEAIAILRHVLGGNVVYPSAMLTRLAGAPEPELLSERQREVLEQIALGRSNDEIAQCLFISRNTVKFHLREIYSRLGVRNRVEASRAARLALGDGFSLPS